jgi:molybdopterin biosynthesis enzyme
LRGEINLHPLPWASSGDVTCFAAANALIRVPANVGALDAGVEVDFLPTAGFGLWPNQSSHRLDAAPKPV